MCRPCRQWIWEGLVISCWSLQNYREWWGMVLWLEIKPLRYRLNVFELQFEKPSNFLCFTFPPFAEVRSHFGPCSLGTCSAYFLCYHLAAICFASGNLKKGYMKVGCRQICIKAQSFSDVSVEEFFLSCPSMDEWLSSHIIWGVFSHLEMSLVLASYLISVREPLPESGFFLKSSCKYISCLWSFWRVECFHFHCKKQWKGASGTTIRFQAYVFLATCTVLTWILNCFWDIFPFTIWSMMLKQPNCP